MKTLNLCGTWKAAWCYAGRGMPDRGAGEEMDPTYYFDAQVPGEMHRDLMAAGMIDDPHVGYNILKARWVEDVLWSYRKHFEAPEDLDGKRAWLYLEGLDLAAAIYLNGEHIGSHCNHFYPCRVEVTGKVKPGVNRLVVQVEAGLIHAANKSVEGLKDGTRERLTKRPWLRKPQFQAGWDWAGRMMNVGLGGPVRLEWTDQPVRPDRFVPLATLSQDLSSGQVEARWFVEGLREEPVEAELVVTIPQFGVCGSERVTIERGQQRCTATVDVANPELWWPVGHGAQPLYTVRAELRVDGREIARTEKRIGFRRVVINQDPHPEGGRSFTIEINNRKIFCKGGNWVPADMIYSPVDRSRLESLVGLALDANFNMLRVWGGGQYESDDFYELCDEKGIVVWQEFIFACGKFPGTDQAFHEDFVKEATWNVRRLAAHPSLVVWCGNNELEWGAFAWSGYQEGQIMPDHPIFHFTLPRLMQREDPTRFYWPSSPYSPDNEFPNADHVGDQHPWIVGFLDTPSWMNFQRFRDLTCRFPNEGGFLGPTSLPTARACLAEGQEQMHSFSWRLHDNTFFNDACAFWLGRTRASMSVEEFVYWGGLIHGEALREYCDSFRRKMFTCSSAVFWMYNDSWPCSRSWTIVDYYLRRTPSFHPVRRALAPVSVVLARESDRVVVFGVNDTRAPVKGSLRFGVFELAGAYRLDTTETVELAPNASTPLASFPAESWTERERTMCFAMLSDSSGNVIARNRYSEGFWKDMVWPAAAPRVRVDSGEAIFESDTFALGVCIDLDGERELADNFFDLYPGMEHRIAWAEAEPLRVLHVGNLSGGSADRG